MRLFAIICLLLLLPFTASAANHTNHGLSLHGKPKYNSLFTHFKYANPNAPKGGEIRLGTIGTYDNVNPFILKGVTAAQASIVFETLMESSLDEPFTQYGRVAKDITVPDDRSWVSYNLRKEARFHDDRPLTADDIIFSFNTLRKEGHPFYRSYYKDVVEAKKLNKYGVKFIFKNGGNAELPLIMGQMPILPKHFWEDKKFNKTRLSPILGSGPYRIESISPARSITYSRVKNWWGTDLPVNKGRYNFNRIRVDYYRDASIATEAFLAGQYDFRLENTAKNWATAYNTPDVKSGLIQRKEIKNELPAGMQGFIFNTRRPLFRDCHVRAAIALAFDFEWSNKTLAYGAYTRTNSYFANSELASHGKITKAESAILKPYKNKIPRKVFTDIYEAPKTKGDGNNRDNLRKAATLLADAGWELKNGTLVNEEGQAFAFEIVDSSPLFERWVQPFIRNLERLGIKATFRVVDSSQYQNLMNDFNFDMTISVFGQSLTPGNEQRDYWSSAKAKQKGSRNIIGIHDPVVNELVEKIIQARSRKELVNLTRALDRVLLWGHYVVPHWNIGSYRVAYWDIFGQPQTAPKYGFDMTSLWWINQKKQKALINKSAKDMAKAKKKEAKKKAKKEKK